MTIPSSPEKVAFRKIPTCSEDSTLEVAASQSKKTFRTMATLPSSPVAVKKFKKMDSMSEDEDTPPKLNRIIMDFSDDEISRGDIPTTTFKNVNKPRPSRRPVISDRDKCLRVNRNVTGTKTAPILGKGSIVKSSWTAGSSPGISDLVDVVDLADSPRSSQIGSHLEHSQFPGSSQVVGKRKQRYGKKSTNVRAPKIKKVDDACEEAKPLKKFKILHHSDDDEDFENDQMITSDADREFSKTILSSLDTDKLFSSSAIDLISDSQSSITDLMELSKLPKQNARQAQRTPANIVSLIDSQEAPIDLSSSPLSVVLDSDDEQVQALEKTKCPMCGESVNKELLISYSGRGQRMTMTEQVAFCRLHKRRTAQASYNAATYPKIDWNTLDQRVTSHHNLITAILDDTHESYYRNVLSEAIQSGTSSRTIRQEVVVAQKGSKDVSQSLTPGYYGSRGLRVISENLMAQFSPRLRRLAVKDKLISAAGGVSSYVQRVLVPEIAVRLISEDMDMDVERARTVMRDSISIGEALNEEIDETVVRRIDDIDEDVIDCCDD